MRWLFLLIVASLSVALAATPQDDIDHLAALMAERLKLAVDVAEYKWNTGQAIEDKPREQAILDGLVDKAAQAGVPAEHAKAFFRAQIEASKMVQRQLFTQWAKQNAGHFANAPDLATATRPKLDALTDKLIEALAHDTKVLADPGVRPYIESASRRYLSSAEWGEAAAVAAAPLLQ